MTQKNIQYNIQYKRSSFGDKILVEAKLVGHVQHEDWLEFGKTALFSQEKCQGLYVLIDENNSQSDLPYEAAKKLIQDISQGQFNEVIINIVSQDVYTEKLSKLYNDLAEVYKTPLRVNYHRTIEGAKNDILKFCRRCYSKIF